MSHRSLRFGRRNADISQAPETATVPHGLMEQRPASTGRHAGIPAPRPTPDNVWRPPVAGNAAPHAGDAPTRVMCALKDAKPNFRDGFTQMLPVVDPSAPLLPQGTTHSQFMAMTELLSAVADPSATVILPLPRSRGVLDALAVEAPVLTAQDDPGVEVHDNLGHTVEGMATSADPDLRRQAMAMAVRWFRAARDMARSREAWCDEVDDRLRRQQARLVEFNASWDARLHAMNEEACGRRITSAGYGLAACYQDEGTAVTLGMADQIKAMILRDALAGSGASR